MNTRENQEHCRDLQEEQGNLSIVYAGKTLKPLQTRRGLVFIESRYLSPMSDYMDVLELYERFTPSGTPYIVAKAGFMLQAVIMPYDAINAQFVKRLQELAEQCAVSLDLREREKDAAIYEELKRGRTGELDASKRDYE